MRIGTGNRYQHINQEVTTNVCNIMDEEDAASLRLLTAVKNGKVRQINALLDKGVDVDIQDDDSKTPLIHAACCDNDDVRTHLVRLLIRNECNVNSQDNNGRTALMYACMEIDRLDVVRLLTRSKECNPNIQDSDGNTAAMHAVSASNVSALRMLINASATKSIVNFNIRNNNGLTALEMSIKLQLFECCKVLATDAGARSGNVRDQKGLNSIMGRDVFIGNQNNVRTIGGQSVTPANIFSPRERTVNSSLNTRRTPTPAPDRQRQGSFNEADYRQGLLRRDKSQLSLSRADMLRSNSKLSVTREETSPIVLTPRQTSWVDNSRRIKRNLTPIGIHSSFSPAPDNRIESESPIVFGNKMKLPSIKSGKRLCIVNNANYDGPETAL